MLTIFIIAFILGISVGLITQAYKAFKPPHIEEIEESKPYYIEEQIQALYEQIAAYNALIKDYNRQLTYTRNNDKALMIEKKKSDLQYKVARLEEKVYKLLDKWGD